MHPITPQQLPDQQVDIWTLAPDQARETGRLNSLQSILSADERSRHRRFRCADAAHQYLLAHGMLRTVLSRYADVPPAGWQFAYGEHGRPEIANPPYMALRFNLTHTAGLIACVIARNRACGIDAEHCIARRHLLSIARRMFSAQECAALERAGDDARLEGFYTGWTLREAYVKARGIGISFPTRKLNFTVRGENDISLSQAPDIDGSGDDWYFRLVKPTAEHLMAVAVERGRDADVAFNLRDFLFEQGLTTGS
jgi:4'-phosphopantetheinyl transferase